MNKTRLESFSDGVFAVVITLLIFSVKLDEKATIVTNADLLLQLKLVLPHVLTFIFTFLIVGVFWVAHHRIFTYVKAVDPKLLWINILYLMFIVLLPFPASILAKHPLLQASILLYCCTLLLIGFFNFLFIRYLFLHPSLRDEGMSHDIFRAALRITSVGPICYIIAIATSFFSVYISFGFVLLPFIYFVFFGGGIKPLNTHRRERKFGKPR